MEKGRFQHSYQRVLLGIILILFPTLVSGQIRVKEPVRDLGDVFEKSGKVTVHFSLENPYRNDTISIIDIITSCGCTAALAEDTVIMPQSAVQLDVVYDPTNRPGLFVKSIELTTQNSTGERHRFYLKIMGNVVQESFTGQKVTGSLEKYQVAPLFFFPVTFYDTSYFQLSYLGSFVDDMTYEIDYYQFTTIGMEIEVRDLASVEMLAPQLSLLQDKIHQEFSKRGFSPNTVFFGEPIFTLSDSIPTWANSSIRLFSINFDAGDEQRSEIIISENEQVLKKKMLLDYERFAFPEVEEVVAEVNFETIESKLFLNGELDLEGTLLLPWKKSDKVRQKFAQKLTKAISKEIKKRTGAKPKDVRIVLDEKGIQPNDKYVFLLWDQEDREPREKLTYQLKPEKIQPPFIPTYRQQFIVGSELDTLSHDFLHFWENLIRNGRQMGSIDLILECGYEVSANEIPVLMQSFLSIESWLINRFKNETGADLTIKRITHASGLQRMRSVKDDYDVSQHNFINLIPLVGQQSEFKAVKPSPYKVNFDLYFNGVDKGAFGFQRFARDLARMVQKYGYVVLRIESSASKIPLDENSSNEWIAFERLLESKKRLLSVMAEKMIDPNRIIFLDESVVVQGPEYDGTVPVLRYRDYHYLQIIPENYLLK